MIDKGRKSYLRLLLLPLNTHLSKILKSTSTERFEDSLEPGQNVNNNVYEDFSHRMSLLRSFSLFPREISYL